MRILHVVTLVSSDGAYGGPLRVAMNQSSELNRRGHQVEIVAGWLGAHGPPDDLGGVASNLFPVLRILPGSRFGGLFSARLGLWLWRRIASFDVVHVHAGRDLVSIWAQFCAAIHGVPYVAQTHGMIMPDRRLKVRILDAIAVRRLLRSAHRVFALTPHEERELTILLGNPASSERLLNGVPLTTRRAGTVAACPEVIFCARLQDRKRPLAFVEMAHLLSLAGVNARYTIIGPDEGALKDLHSAIAKYGLADRVFYEGALPYEDILGRLERAQIYVLPSVHEPFPMSLLEALSLGLPSVCTSSCGIAELLARESAALVSDPEPASLAVSVKRLIDDEDFRKRIGNTGLRIAKNQFSISVVVDQLERSYCQVVAS